MTTNNTDLLQTGWNLVTRIFMKYDFLEKIPVDLGMSDKLNAAQIHMIEAIGKGFGKTVTSLSNHFMITKGAVSQVITRLYSLGFIMKIKKQGNNKEIILELTRKGQMAFDLHEQYNQLAISRLVLLEEKYSREEVQSFLSVLYDIDQILTSFVEEEKEIRSVEQRLPKK